MVEFQKLNTLRINPDAGLFVIDANLQGIVEYEGFAENFPKAFNIYQKVCRFNYKNRVGKIMIVEENNKRLAFLFTRQNRNEKEEVILENFNKCLIQLFNIVPSDIFIYSPFLGRKQRLTTKYFNAIRRVEKSNGEASRVWRFFNERT